MFPPVGQPVMVGADDSAHGPFYDDPGNKALRESNSGEWSDSMWDMANYPSMLDGLTGCLLSCCCPCFVMYRTIERVGTVKTPFGDWNKKRFLSMYVICCVAYMIIKFLRIPPNLMCKPVPEVDEDHPVVKHWTTPGRGYSKLYDMDAFSHARSLFDAAGVTSDAADAASGATEAASDAAGTASGYTGSATDAAGEASDYTGVSATDAAEAASSATDRASGIASAAAARAEPGSPAAHGAAIAAANAQPFYDSATSAFGPDGGAPPPPEKEVKMHCYNLWTILVDIICRWVIPFLAIKGVKDKLQLKEDDKITLIKSPCLPECFLCFQCCALSQVLRHVDRVQGFTPVAEENIASLQGNE